MSAKVHRLARPQVIDDEILCSIEDMVAAARRGEVVDIAFVCNDASGQAFYRMSQFQDAWRLIGALEYMKDSVLRGMDGGGGR